NLAARCWARNAEGLVLLSLSCMMQDTIRRTAPSTRLITEPSMKMTAITFAVLMAAGASPSAAAAEVKVLTAGAFKQVLVALLPEIEKQSGNKVALDNDTVGALVKR